MADVTGVDGEGCRSLSCCRVSRLASAGGVESRIRTALEMWPSLASLEALSIYSFRPEDFEKEPGSWES